jgi:hypothetical protein
MLRLVADAGENFGHEDAEVCGRGRPVVLLIGRRDPPDPRLIEFASVRVLEAGISSEMSRLSPARRIHSRSQSLAPPLTGVNAGGQQCL